MTSVADAVKAMQAKFNPAAAAGLDLVLVSTSPTKTSTTR